MITALAANWSTCGMSVAGVVVAPKQPGRRGSSTPLRRLGWHAAGSVSTGAVTGAAIGALGGFALGAVPVSLLLGLWAVLAAAYGLHELGLLSMPTPMRRKQLPRRLDARLPVADVPGRSARAGADRCGADRARRVRRGHPSVIRHPQGSPSRVG